MLITTDCNGESNSKCWMIQTLPDLRSSYVRPETSGPSRILLKSELHMADYTGSPRRYPYFDVVEGLVWSYELESYAGGSVCYW